MNLAWNKAKTAEILSYFSPTESRLNVFFFSSPLAPPHTDYVDSYRALVFKVMAWMNWVVLNCPDVDFIVKTDDDMVINMFELSEHLERNRDLRKVPKYQCLVWGEDQMVIYRDPEHKW